MGGASFALKKAGIEFECIGYSEIDKFAIQCYEQNHKNPVYAIDVYNKKIKYNECIGTLGRYNGSITNAGSFPVIIPEKIKNYGDATKINPHDLPDFDLLTGGFPCQAFSVAGKGLGEQDTRGTLFNDIIRIAEVKKPKYMLLENVKGLLSKKHKATFDKILSELERIGYNVKWKVLNSKEHGIPQNRERVFFVCFLDPIDFSNFDFPEKEELNIFLKDILEKDVINKYYLSEKTINTLIRHNNKVISREDNPEVSGTIHTNYFKMGGRDQQYLQAKTICINSKNSDGVQPKIQDRIYDINGVSLAVVTAFMPSIAIVNATKKGYLEATIGDGVNLDFPTSNTRRGRVIKGCAGTLQCNDGRGVIDENMRIRKLTPTEYFRLMGFLNDEINLDGLSNTQMYKLAGNGWDINLVSKIFKNMFKGE